MAIREDTDAEMANDSQDTPQSGDIQAENEVQPVAGPQGLEAEAAAQPAEQGSQDEAQAAEAEAGRESEPAEAEPGAAVEGAPEGTPSTAEGAEAEEEREETPLVCVRYGRMGLLGLFRSRGEEILPHTRVVIKSDRGLELGTALCPGNKQMLYEGKPLKRVGSIRRIATHDDLMEERHFRQSEDREKEFCEQRINELKLPMRLAAVEHLFGGDRIVFYFLSDGRVDFRQLVRDLAHEYQTRIEMRQIGVRDEARLLADYERCGQPVCCGRFIKEFQPVSMRMAKLQKATLDPSKISGRCGRLMCCLRYEFDTYEELRKNLPKRNSFVLTEEHGPGKVIDTDILTQLVKVDVGGKVEVVPVEAISKRNLSEGEVTELAAARQREAFRPRRREASASRPSAGADRRGAAPDRAKRSAESEAAEAAGEPSEGGAGQDRPERSKRRGRRRRKRRPTEAGAAGQSGQGPQGGGSQGNAGAESGAAKPGAGDGEGAGGEKRQGEPSKRRRRSHRGRRRSKRRSDSGGAGAQGGGPQT